MTQRDEPTKSLRITAIAVPDAAKVLASAYGRRVTEAQVRQIAERGGQIGPGDTINLLEYTAYLVRETSHGPD